MTETYISEIFMKIIIRKALVISVDLTLNHTGYFVTNTHSKSPVNSQANKVH